MRGRSEPLGRILVRMGTLGEDALTDALQHTSGLLRLGSVCYVLGLASEEDLARGLSKQRGIPAVVFDRSIVHLAILRDLSPATLLEANVLPVFEDATRLVVAVDDAERAREALRRLEEARGKSVIPHIAVRVTLARTLRECLRGAARGELYWVGALAAAQASAQGGALTVVSGADGAGGAEVFEIPEALIEDVTKEADLALFPPDDDDELDPAAGPPRGHDDAWAAPAPEVSTSAGSDAPLTPISIFGLPSDTQDGAPSVSLDDDEDPVSADPEVREGPQRVLIVDDDFATRHLLVKELQPLGYITLTAASGPEAIRAIRASAPDLVVIDVMLPEIDGFQVCRAIKDSRRYGQTLVVLMSAVIDSGRLTPEVLTRYGVDAYFEKPLNTEKVRLRIRQLLNSRSSVPPIRDDSFERAIALYKGGELDPAMAVLRTGLELDPLSAKHHFVLANLLQKKGQLHEAIDEYEATIDLKPDYFPALTRLAYLYYRKGYVAKAIETWQRSLPLCGDAGLRLNIELFMRKLIAEMHAQIQAG